MKTTAQFYSDMKAANAAYAKAIRKTARQGTPANFADMTAKSVTARAAYRAFWAQPDAMTVAKEGDAVAA